MTALPVRLIEVVGRRRPTPMTCRITFGGPDLADFAFIPDQQVKLCFPPTGAAVPRLPAPTPDGDPLPWYREYLAMPEHERPRMRGYTVRAHRADEGVIDVDFALRSDAGPATRWARDARVGDVVGMVGPSPIFARSRPLSASIAAGGLLLLAGDESALPGIGTLIETLPARTRALALIEVADRAEEQRFETHGEVTVRWLHRGETPPGTGGSLLDALRAAEFPPERTVAWLAAEAAVARGMRGHLVAERGMAGSAVEFAGYWRAGRTQDDAPTAADLADARARAADARTR
ncbi:NADPH-dependent ferric siderophore reductase [Actinoalloteichus hoggarensis]|uniref:Vibriobactin utilization protein ViuB n=1 Tax=Actinoalloteichus hoggarensis TaxID=1470176 RepID=A0A221WAS7_9PSEU|nr:siderophore-interacting protein [Actinoalloteichus hoggarensis]ASO23100.1 Vibriobactin utilization protein ViuB [Actinoalloteichus hoggarensis]MBB5922705.1 NADPH-dependent ferric siderophore reductase [Actinoalloteichus hoggarensis]